MAFLEEWEVVSRGRSPGEMFLALTALGELGREGCLFDGVVCLGAGALTSFLGGRDLDSAADFSCWVLGSGEIFVTAFLATLATFRDRPEGEDTDGFAVDAPFLAVLAAFFRVELFLGKEGI